MEFRKSAVDKLASPERLDVLMRVTSPMGWAALAAIGLVLAAAIAWSIYADIGDKVIGQGVLVRGSGSRWIVAEGAGVLTLNVKDTDAVKPGDVIGQIAVAGNTQALDAALQRLNSARATYEGERIRAEARISDNQTAITTTRGLKSSEEATLTGKEGELATKKALPNVYAQRELDAIQAEINASKARIAGFDAQISARDQDSRNARAGVQQWAQQVAQAEKEYQRELASRSALTTITANAGGRVVELPKRTGDTVAPGTPIARLDSEEGELQAYVYVGATEGGRIKASMPAQIDLLSTFRREEVGLLLGEVAVASVAPVSRERVLSVVGNPEVVNQIFGSGPVTEIQVGLKRDPNTATGFEWSSGQGPAAQLSANLPIMTNIIVGTKQPYEMIVPALKRFFGAS